MSPSGRVTPGPPGDNTLHLTISPASIPAPTPISEHAKARTAAGLAPGTRLADYITLGLLTAVFPMEAVCETLLSTGRMRQRERELPAHVMVYCAIALALYADVSTREVLRCLLEGGRWLGQPGAGVEPAGPSGISQARSRLGVEPLEQRYRAAVGPVAMAETPGAWYRGWRVMRPDGTTLDVADTAANRRAFGRPASARGVNTTGAFPQLRIVGLDVADRQGHHHQRGVLEPALKHRVPHGVRLKIQSHFHEAIRGRIDRELPDHGLRLPEIEPMLELDRPQTWCPVPGTHDGFSYRPESPGVEAKLISESWTRVVGGSGQRHEITSQGSRLVEEGFAWQMEDDQCGSLPNTSSSVRFVPGREVASTGSPLIWTASWFGRGSVLTWKP